MNAWTILQDSLFLLLGAILLGALFERFERNAVLGPHAFDALPNRDAILSITVPDPAAARAITAHARAAARDAIIVTRSRYQSWNEDLLASGATSVLGEEAGVGLQVAFELQKALDATELGLT